MQTRFQSLLMPVILVLLASAARADNDVKPPAQPADGPGGAKAMHAAVVHHTYGDGNTQYIIFEPDQPRPETAPVVIFIHGWTAINPAIYGAWIDHIVKRGNIVIFPRYQAGIATPPGSFTGNTITALQDAFNRLDTEPDHVKPQLDHIAAVGHSVGGLLVANIGALAAESKLPPISAIMSTEPGKTIGGNNRPFVPLADMSKLPANTLLLAVAGDNDTLVGTTDALRIFHESVNLRPENKNYVMVHSDPHGSPVLDASHLAPVAPDITYDTTGAATTRPALANSSKMLDALDYYAYWKLFDALCDTAFTGTHRDIALGNTSQQRDMGKWSDGTPVREMQITLGEAPQTEPTTQP